MHSERKSETRRNTLFSEKAQPRAKAGRRPIKAAKPRMASPDPETNPMTSAANQAMARLPEANPVRAARAAENRATNKARQKTASQAGKILATLALATKRTRNL